MDEKTKVVIQGRIFEATRIPVQNTQEGWNEYLLTDGTIARVKLVLTEIVRVEGLYEEDGSPVYQLKHNVVASIIAAPELKKLPPGVL